MKILAIETSCDDTSLAIFEDEKLLFMDTKSQIKIHNLTGWVVPEVAAREHANAIFEVLENVLTWVNLKIEEIDLSELGELWERVSLWYLLCLPSVAIVWPKAVSV